MKVSWELLSAELENCRKCDLCAGRNNIVPGEGNPYADIMLIGEGPGFEEDRQGRPFVGPSGELLTRMLHAIDLKREDVYICNIVKCRPPRNRNPEPGEALACLDYLRAQVALVRPKIIILLGKVACRYTLGMDMSIMQAHGKWIDRKGVRFLPTFHPSFLLRSPDYKRAAWEDFKKVREYYDELIKDDGNNE